MSVIDWLKLVTQFFPTILQVIIAIEAALPGVAGTTKKAVALAVLNPPTAQAADVGTLVDSAVGALNTTGVFAKTA